MHGELVNIAAKSSDEEEQQPALTENMTSGVAI